MNYIAKLAVKELQELVVTDFAAFNHDENECSKIRKARAKYQTKSDTLYHFISLNYERTENPKDRIKATEFDTAYSNWCGKTGRKPVSDILRRIKGLGLQKKKARLNGGNPIMCYCGLKLLIHRKSDDEDIDDSPSGFSQKSQSKIFILYPIYRMSKIISRFIRVIGYEMVKSES